MHRSPPLISLVTSLVLLFSGFAGTSGASADEALARDAAAALKKAAAYWGDRVSTDGGYLWEYSLDLKSRRGENAATDTTVWIQPPGTPSMGEAFLTAHQATGDAFYLDAAKAVAGCLIRGQLRSGGWGYSIEFDPEKRNRYDYRVDPASDPADTVRRENTTVFDDNTSQAALRFLMRLDAELKFADQPIHEAATYALDSIIRAQYPNGAWPQRYYKFPEPEKFPPLKASYPDDWPRVYEGVNYNSYYTFNDNAMGDLIDVMLAAGRTYNEPRYTGAAERCGDFILSAQMPEPQPVWAQQYDAEMHPAWARKFEPPSVTGGETQNILLSLLQLYTATGDKRYLAPVPPALAWLKKSQLKEGEFARFYELRTNRPLYFTLDYALTYTDDDMPTHYGFKVGTKLPRLEREHAKLSTLSANELAQLRERAGTIRPEKLTPELEKEARGVVAALDDQGRWLADPGKKSSESGDVLRTDTFIRNANVLSRYLAACQAAKVPF